MRSRPPWAKPLLWAPLVFVACLTPVSRPASQPTSPVAAPPHAGNMTVSVRDYGAMGDGKTDDTAAIQRAVDAVGHAGGGTVNVPAAIYSINPVARAHSGIMLRDNVTLAFQPGAVLKAIPNASPNYAILAISHASNVTIEGGVLEGERDRHLGTGGEWGMCLTIGNGARNITVKGTVSKDCWGDGFYVSDSTNVLLLQVDADHNRRQGLSITSGTDVVVRDSVFQNTGGTRPESGIDLEPNKAGLIDHAVIEGCRVLNNAGSGISDGVPSDYEGSAKIRDVTITGNLVSGNGSHSLRPPPMSGIELTLVSGHRVTNNTVADNVGFGVYLRYRATGNVITGNQMHGNSLGPLNQSKDNTIENNELSAN